MLEGRFFRRAWVAAVLLALACLLPRPLAAQVSASQKAAAEALFDRGVALLKEGNLDAACQKLEQSQAIEPGIGTQLYLAECYARQGRTASAWALFREAASRASAAGQTERAEAGRARANELQPGLSTLTLRVSPERALEGLVVTRDGSEVAESLWNEPLPVDPGEHVLEASAPGHLAWSGKVQVAAGGEAATFELPLLQPAPVVAEAEAAPEPSEPVGAPEPAPASPRPARMRLAGWVLGGAGVAAVVLGAGFGGRAIRKNNDAKDACDGRCPAKEDLTNEAFTAANVSTGLWVAGGALVVGGLTLLLTSGRQERRTAQGGLRPGVMLGREGAAVTLGGTF